MAKKEGSQGEEVWQRKEEDKEKKFGKERRKTRRRSLAKKEEDKEKKSGKERRKTRRRNLVKKGGRQGKIVGYGKQAGKREDNMHYRRRSMTRNK